uniref:hypothetical protein n=1 Tax=[Kitasatospora] papulosa TaxID=1464011 RepID=UPI0036DF0EAE
MLSLIDRDNVNRTTAIKLIPFGQARRVRSGQLPTQSTYEHVVSEHAEASMHRGWHVVETASEDEW